MLVFSTNCQGFYRFNNFETAKQGNREACRSQGGDVPGKKRVYHPGNQQLLQEGGDRYHRKESGGACRSGGKIPEF